MLHANDHPCWIEIKIESVWHGYINQKIRIISKFHINRNLIYKSIIVFLWLCKKSTNYTNWTFIFWNISYHSYTPQNIFVHKTTTDFTFQYHYLKSTAYKILLILIITLHEDLSFGTCWLNWTFFWPLIDFNIFCLRL